MGPGRVLSTGTRLRVAIAVFTLLINAVHGSSATVLPWTLLVLGMDLATGALLTVAPLRPHERRVLALVLTFTSSAIAGLALSVSVGALLLVIIPVFRALEVWSLRAATMSLLLYGLPAVVMLVGSSGSPSDVRAGSLALWGALTLTLGALAIWSWHIARPEVPENALAHEAAWLLNRLESLATELRSGFDPATSAEHLLDALPDFGSQPRSGVLVGGRTERAVPLALRGSLRVPWIDPRDDQGAVGSAWQQGRPASELIGNRLVVAAPLRDTRDRQIGIVIADALTDAGDGAEWLSGIVRVARQHQALVAVSLAFGSLRERAGIEERQRLAHQIHDGIAQELVALGFRMDRLKRLPGEQLPTEVADIRTEVSRILADVRSHIGDLRLTVRPEVGLGAAISSQLQIFGATTGAIVTSRLSESSFRLPAHVETGLYRIVLDFLADVRRSEVTGEVEVFLRTQAPEAQLVLRQSGQTRLTESELSPHLPASLGAIVIVSSTSTGSEISVRLTALPDSAALLEERLPQPT